LGWSIRHVWPGKVALDLMVVFIWRMLLLLSKDCHR
jgi:hypothetical protein